MYPLVQVSDVSFSSHNRLTSVRQAGLSVPHTLASLHVVCMRRLKVHVLSNGHVRVLRS